MDIFRRSGLRKAVTGLSLSIFLLEAFWAPVALANETNVVIARKALSYDLNGNLTQVDTPNNEQIQYEYDELNRLVQRTDPDGTTVSFTYDANGNRLSMTDGQGKRGQGKGVSTL